MGTGSWVGVGLFRQVGGCLRTMVRRRRRSCWVRAEGEGIESFEVHSFLLPLVSEVDHNVDLVGSSRLRLRRSYTPHDMSGQAAHGHAIRYVRRRMSCLQADYDLPTCLATSQYCRCRQTGKTILLQPRGHHLVDDSRISDTLPFEATDHCAAV
jgi:hypothetical protein